MFCANCGKELEENAKFCPECGALTNAAADTMNASPEPKIGGTGDYEKLKQMTEKAGKTQKVTRMITTALILVYAFVVARGLLDNLSSVLEGREELTKFVLMVFVMILVTCALLHTGLEIVLPFLQGKKAVCAEEYLKYIQVSDRRALMHALAQMKCASVKSVYMDEHGDVCVAGKKSKHTFTVQDNIPVMTSKKDSYKAVLERETIAGCLLKFLVPEAPVNAYENEKSNARLSRMRMLVAAVAAVSGVILIIVAVIFGTGSRYIDMVKNGYPEIYPNITYGQAFDAFFSDGEWEYFSSGDGLDVVEFNGGCFRGDDRVTVTIQFVVYEEQGTFEVYTAAIDGEVQPELIYSLLLLNIFESYGNSDREGKLQLEEQGDVSYLTDQEEIYLPPENEMNDFDAWAAGLDNTVKFESIMHLSGLWSDGNIEMYLGIYTDADEYTAYDEIGTCSYGEIIGTLYFLGSDDTNFYLIGELTQRNSVLLQCWGNDEITIIDATEGLTPAIGAVLYCTEHYEP